MIQQKLTKTKTKMILITKTLVIFPLFTALHVMQTRYCDENSVRLSVRLSVCHTRVL